MDIRHQITILSIEVKEIIEEHLKEKGYKIKSGSFSKEGSYFCTLFSEEELYMEKTKELLSKPIDFFNFKNEPELGKKIEHPILCRLKDLLEIEFPSNPDEESLLKFKSENVLRWHLFEGEKSISKKEERFLIKEFKKHEIHVHVRKD